MNAIYNDGDLIYVDNFAEVTNGIVTNLLWIAEVNADDFPNCIRIGNRPVSIGDTYDNGVFYHNGVMVRTADEMLYDAQSALLILGVTE